MEKFSNSNQLKAYMKKESKRLGIGFNNTYVTFVAREFLERISKNNDGLVLIKGSCVETAYLGNLVRAITDLDLCELSSIDHYIDLLTTSFPEKDGYFHFALSRTPHITNTGIYKTTMEASLDKTKQSLGIDVQEHYNRLIERKMIDMPRIFEGDKEFKIFVPSLEEHIAEKLCIVVESNKTDVLNTRVKDFYDIYKLIHNGDYDKEKISKYFINMLKLRGKIKLEDVTTDYLNSSFISNHSSLWDSTRQKYDFVDRELKFGDAVDFSKEVIDQEFRKGIESIPYQKVKK